MKTFDNRKEVPLAWNMLYKKIEEASDYIN